MTVVCEYCHGSGQPNGVMGGPGLGLCAYCRGSGKFGVSSFDDTFLGDGASSHQSDKDVTIASLRAELDAVKAERDAEKASRDIIFNLNTKQFVMTNEAITRTTTAEAQLAAAHAALREARERILALRGVIGSLPPGDMSIARIDAALSQLAPDLVRETAEKCSEIAK